MADVDSRGDYYPRGGGRGAANGGYNRKRRHREDEDFERRPQRRRYEEPLSVRVRKQILAVSESAFRRPEDEVEQIATTIVDNIDDDYFIRTVVELLPQLVVEQPFKILSVAAITLNANSRKPQIAQSIISATATLLQKRLDDGDLRAVKLLLRFLASIQVLFDDEGVFGVLDELFNRAVELQTASSEDAVGLELVKIILLTIPYALIWSSTALQEKASELLEKTDIIASTPHVLDGLVDPYTSVHNESHTTSQSIISLLQKRLQDEAASSWSLSFIPRLNKSPTESQEKHAFPTIAVPDPINFGYKALFPEVYFSIYAEQEVESVPPTSALASLLIRDTLVDTINILDFNRTAAAKSLVDLDCYWESDTFVKRATPFDKLKETTGKSTWKPEDLAVDAIFSQMLQLPMPEHKLVYYHALITETCKIAPAAIAPSLGRAIRFLYRKIDSMDAELSYRFLDWFAHHLSNFDFRWKWTEWVEDVNLSPLYPRKAFILGALDKEVRLSFARRIRETLPQEYQVLIPASKDNDIPTFKYSVDTVPFAEQGRQLLSLLKKKAPESDLQPIFDLIHTGAAAHNFDDQLVPSTDAYVTAICHIGSKSLSHVLSYVERCKDRLLDIGQTSPIARNQIIDSVVTYWLEQNPGVAVNIIDKLLNYTILTPAGVIKWALIDHVHAGRRLSETWLYEMVSSTVFKVTNRVRQIVLARNQVGHTAEQFALYEETLGTERAEMRKLFAIIDDALVGIANGANDEMLEFGDGTLEGDLDLTKGWAQKWLRVFRRKFAVEEAVLTELLKVVPQLAPAPTAEMDVDRAGGIDAGDEEVEQGIEENIATAA